MGKKVTSKQLPLGFADMPANFINAYILGNVGSTGTSLGACATFQYNLAQAVRDIQNGTHRVVIVGGSEAPILPEIIEAFAAMGAIANDGVLQALDGGESPDYRRACRPFGNNIGFTLGESCQFFVLMDDALALELGASILASVNDVFVNADGFKKSIASPGVGNYMTFARAAAATRSVLGDDSLRNRTFIQAHGTGTPQNRVTESAILAEVATHFGASNWKVSAVKAYLGHSLGVAGADQLASSLGIWQYGILPGILSTRAIADDVHTKRLEYLLQHQEIDPGTLDSILINAKGFGGNNATAAIMSPQVTQNMLEKRHGKKAMTAWQLANEDTTAAAQDYEAETNRQAIRPIYHFDHDVRDGEDLSFSANAMHLRGYGQAINLDLPNKYKDMC
jgi:acetoacetyl-[acyl-carrier protein] synthase